MINTGSIMRTSIDDMTERVSVIYATKSRDARGAIIDGEPVTRCTVWAKVLPLNAPMSDSGVERKAAVTYRIVIRYRTDILPNDILLWRGKRLKQTNTPYDAESRHVWTVLECQEVLADGQTQSLP